MLTELERYMILDAVKTEGTYNPDEIMYLFEESLTFPQYRKISGFLRWVHQTGLKFGHGNIDVVYSNYLEAKANEQA